MKDDGVYLQHIRELQDIDAYCGSDHEAFLSERMRQDATLRKLEIVGQAVKNLSDPTKSRQPDIPWKQIAGMRDKVIHDRPRLARSLPDYAASSPAGLRLPRLSYSSPSTRRRSPRLFQWSGPRPGDRRGACPWRPYIAPSLPPG